MLQDARIKQGMTQQELADKLGVGTQSISNMERDIAPIPAKHFKRISSLLKISTDALIELNAERYIQRLKRRMNKQR